MFCLIFEGSEHIVTERTKKITLFVHPLSFETPSPHISIVEKFVKLTFFRLLFNRSLLLSVLLCSVDCVFSQKRNPNKTRCKALYP